MYHRQQYSQRTAAVSPAAVIQQYSLYMASVSPAVIIQQYSQCSRHTAAMSPAAILQPIHGTCVNVSNNTAIQPIHSGCITSSNTANTQRVYHQQQYRKYTAGVSGVSPAAIQPAHSKWCISRTPHSALRYLLRSVLPEEKRLQALLDLLWLFALSGTSVDCLFCTE